MTAWRGRHGGDVIVGACVQSVSGSLLCWGGAGIVQQEKPNTREPRQGLFSWLPRLMCAAIPTRVKSRATIGFQDSRGFGGRSWICKGQSFLQASVLVAKPLQIHWCRARLVSLFCVWDEPRLLLAARVKISQVARTHKTSRC